MEEICSVWEAPSSDVLVRLWDKLSEVRGFSFVLTLTVLDFLQEERIPLEADGIVSYGSNPSGRIIIFSSCKPLLAEYPVEIDPLVAEGNVA
jgi:hypothetical protein